MRSANQVKFVRLLQWLIVLFALSGAIPLAFEQYVSGGRCPSVISIPACYIVLAALCFIVLAMLFKSLNNLYFVGVGAGVIVALSGMLFEVSGTLQCPQTETGIPMCFISVGVFFSLLLLGMWPRR